MMARISTTVRLHARAYDRAPLFLMIGLTALVLAVLVQPETDRGGLLRGLALLIVLALVLAGLMAALAMRLGAAVPIAFVAFIALARDHFGGAQSGFSSLLLLPLVWAAMHRSRHIALATLAALVTALALPIVLIGAPAYPDSEWRRVVAYSFVGGMLIAAIWSAQRDSTHDPLTGLGNRRLWDQALQQEMARARRRNEQLSVAVIDLDHLKHFNDTHGHVACDRFIAYCAASWQHAIRPEDVLTRVGGDEFLLLLPAVDTLDAALPVLRRLQGAMPIGQSCSIGIAIWDGAETAEQLVRRADAALYTVKRRQRGMIGITAASPAAPIFVAHGWRAR